MRIAIAVMVVLFSGPAFSAKFVLPTNVTTTSGPYRGVYVDTVDFSYMNASAVAFSRAKLCVAESITSRSVNLQDASGSFVGAATGTYYRNDNTHTVQGGSLFKYIDDSAQTLIASGTIDGGASSLGLVHHFLKFDVKVVTAGEEVAVKFTNVTRAQQNTGNLANDGFQPVGIWKGSRFQQAYDALEGVANKIKLCLK